MKQNILNDFFIIIKDNFLDQKLLLELQQTLPTLNYEAQRNTIENINHIWFSADADNNVAHVGFNENRAVLWHSNTWHTPMNWAADNKSKRYSIICQFKEL